MCNVSLGDPFRIGKSRRFQTASSCPPSMMQAKQGQDKAGEYTQAAKDKAGDLTGSTKETAGQTQDKAGSYTQAAKDKAGSAADTMGSKVRAIRRRWRACIGHADI